MANNIDNIVTIVLSVAGSALASEQLKALVKKIIARLKPHDLMVRQTIQISIDNLRVRLGADMVNIWQASNGTDSLAGFSYKYLNMIFESFDVLTGKSVKQNFRNTPVEDYLPLLIAIHESDKFFIGTAGSDIAILRAAYKAFGIKMGVDYKFANKDVYKGFLSVSFNEYRNLSAAEMADIEATTVYVYSLIHKLKK